MASKDKDSNGDEISSSGNSKTTRRRAQIRSLCPSLPREFDIFGFYLSPKHSLIALIISYLMVGLIGSEFKLFQLHVRSGRVVVAGVSILIPLRDLTPCDYLL